MARVASKFVIDNSPAIISGLAVAGAVTTAMLTGKAAYTAGRMISDAERSPVGGLDEELTTREKLDLTWRLYIPAIGTLGLTVAAIITANRIGARRAAALAAAFKISEEAFTEYKTKVIEKIGENKNAAIEGEVAQDRVNRIVPSSEIIYVAGTQQCYDAFSGRIFTSDMEALRQAQNTLNHMVLSNFYASLSDYYDLIGLPPIQTSDEVGWNSDKLLDCHYSAVLHDKIPMIHIEFTVVPIRGFDRIV